MALPALRNVDVTPVEQDGETVICLRDPDGFVEQQIALSPPAFFVAACLDGTTDVVDIQQAFAQQFRGALVMSEDILQIVEQLDELGFLLTDRFFAMAEEVTGAFIQSETRPAYISGASYPDEPEGNRGQPPISIRKHRIPASTRHRQQLIRIIIDKVRRPAQIEKTQMKSKSQ